MATTTSDNPNLWDAILRPDSTKPIPRRLIFIDNWPNQLYQTCKKIDDEWLIGIVTEPNDLLHKLEIIKENSKLMENLVVSVDLVLPPATHDDPRIGLNLLRTIREKYGTIKLVVHSGVELRELPILEILELGASFVMLREDDEHILYLYANVLDHILDGCVILSPRPARELTTLANIPEDPFAGRSDLWDTLELLLNGKSYNDVALILEEGISTISERVKAMYAKLNSLGYEVGTIAEDPKTRYPKKEPVVDWAEKHKSIVRYYLRKRFLSRKPNEQNQ